MSEQVYTFKGVNVENMTKEELIQAYKYTCDQLKELNETYIEHWQTQQDLDEALARIKSRRGNWEWK